MMGSRGRGASFSDLSHGVPLGLLGIVLGTSWTAFVLAELGFFCAWAAVLVGLMVGGALCVYGIRSQVDDELDRSELWSCLLASSIAVGSLFLTLPAGEMILGGWDPGVYIHTAAAVSQSRSLQFPADDFKDMSKGQLLSVSQGLHGIPEPYPGMRLLRNGKLSPQFFHLYPSLMAVTYTFFGLPGCLSLNACLNIGCILAMYCLVSRMWGQRWGLMAAALLALNPAQIWQAKFQTAEMLTQLLLLSGTAALLNTAQPGGRRLAAALAGVCYGLALITRYDTILFLAPLCVFLLWLASTQRVPRSVFLTVGLVLLCGCHALIHIKLIAPYYHPLPHLVVPAITIMGALGIMLTVVGRLWITFFRRPLPHLTTTARLLMGCLFATFVFWAWYVRPRLTFDGHTFRAITSWAGIFGQTGLPAVLSDPNAWNMHRLSEVFGWTGLLLACGGITIMLASPQTCLVRAWLISSLCVMGFLVTNALNDHFMMWIMRRFVPVVIPVLVVGAVAICKHAELQARKLSSATGRVSSLACFMLVLLSCLPASYTMAASRNWPGLAGWCGTVNAAMPRDSTLFCDQSGFAAPFRFLYGHKSYEVNIGASDSRADLNSLIRAVVAESPNVYFLSKHGEPDIPGVAIERQSKYYLSSSILRQPKVRFPSGTKNRSGSFVLYRLTKDNE